MYSLLLNSVGCELEMVDEEWVERIRKIKEEAQREVSQISSAEEKLRERYQHQKKEIIDMIHSELKPVVETFKEPALPKYEQPKIERHDDWGISLSVPIVDETTHMSSGIDFSLKLTEKGYGVSVTRERMSRFIYPPIEVKTIQEEIVKYLEERRESIISREKERQRFRREWG